MDKRYPLISIIVPVYGVENYLNKCILSIVRQTYKNIEVILVDDGSPDTCPQIIDQWAREDERIVVVHKINGGQSTARNKGLDCARGKYITFVDSDDWIEPEYIEILYKTLYKFESDIAVVYPQNYKENCVSRKPFYQYSENISFCCTSENAVKYFLECAVAVMGKLYKAEMWKDIRFPEGRKAEEYIVQLNILKQSHKVAFCNRYLYNYYVRSNSDSHDIKPKYRVDNIQAISEVLDFCKEHFPAEQEWASTWLAALLHEFYSVSEFGKVEKQQYKDLLEYAIRQVGGLDRICYKIKYPLDRIIYIARQYHAWMTTPEKKKLQKEYRDVFLKIHMRGARRLKKLKYILGYINLKIFMR